MEGKRALTEQPRKRMDIKRAKAEYRLDIVLGGIEYINLSCLLKMAPFAAYFAKHYKTARRFVEVEKDIEVFNVSKENISKGKLLPKEAYSPGCDLRLVEKGGKINDFIERVKRASHSIAPAIILDDDLIFADENGKGHRVEMRGERTEAGIYFKVKDIGRVFEMKNLADDIQHKHTRLEEGADYVWFTIAKEERKKYGSSHELFFTHSGMILAVFISKSSVAKQFRGWASQIVFIHNHGTRGQKTELARTLNKKTVDKVTKACATDIACVYLLETSKSPCQEDGVARKVYKFGYSKNIKDRMSKHVATYGHESIIDTLIFIPVNYLSEAETKLKHALGKRYVHEDGSQTELLLLSSDDRNTVRSLMRTVGETFYGETLVHTHQLEMMKKTHELELISAKRDGELAKKDITILELRIEILENKLRQYTKPDADVA